jgi:hypothetical protein
MSHRFSLTQLSADFAALGTIRAVARKYGVDYRTIQSRLPHLRVPGLKKKTARAAFLHSIGFTLDEVAAATGLTASEVVEAVRARHVHVPAADLPCAIATQSGR